MIWLKTYLEDWLKVDVEVTRTKGNFGDYTTNLVMKKLASKDDTLDRLSEHPLIENVEFKNGYINVFIKTTPLFLEGTLGKHARMLTLHNLMAREGYIKGKLPEHWFTLAKLTGELFYCLEEALPHENIYQDILSTFNQLDLGYIYRTQSAAALGGIYQLLHDTLIVLGRIDE